VQRAKGCSRPVQTHRGHVYRPENLECGKAASGKRANGFLYNVVGIENFQTGLRKRPPVSGRSMHRSLKTTSKSPREPVALGKLEILPTASSSDLVK
jgi:hypothetical protein